MAWTIRTLVFVVPIVVSFLAALFLSRWLPDYDPFWQRLIRWLGIAVVATLVLMATESLLRRLLPLAALLSLTLVFPDETPSRFGIALRGMSARQLAKRLDEVEDEGLGETPQEAATTLLSLVGALSRHDRLTRGHSERVRAYSQLIGEEMDLDEEQLDGLRWAGLLHDVGKMAVPQEILNKPGKLTDEEFAVIKTHPAHGRAMVAPLAEWLGDSSRAVYEHHERWTGGGYPTGVSGEHIAMESRIVSVADAFDVMTSARSYKKAIPLSDARAELQRCAGSQFDPAVVRAMMNVSLGRLWRAMGPLAWIAQIGLFPRAFAGSAPAANAAVAAVVAAVLTTVSAAVPDFLRFDGSDDDVQEATAFNDATTTTVRSPVEVIDGSSGAGSASDSADGVVTSSNSPGAGGADAAESAPAIPITPAGADAAADGEAAPLTVVAPGGTSRVPAGGRPGGPTPVVPGTSPPGSPTTSVPGGTTSPPSPSTTTVPGTSPPSPSTTTVPGTPPSPTTTSVPGPTTTSVPGPTTTSVPGPTTTLPPASSLALASLSVGDQVAQPVLDLVAGSGPQNPGPVPNYDTDRNDDPGLTLSATPAGLNSTEPDGVQAWRFPATVTTLTGTQTLQLWLAAGEPGPGHFIVRAGLYECDAARESCVRLAQDTLAGQPPADQSFVPVTFQLTIPATTLEPGRRFELRVAPISGSTSDLWVAYDSAETPATLDIDTGAP